MLLRLSASEQSIHHGSHAQQVVRLSHQFTIAGLDGPVRCRVRPLDGNDAAAAVGKQQQEPKTPLAKELLQDRNGLPFEDMRLARDPDRRRKLAEVGSVAYGRSTTWTGTGSSGFWNIASETGG